DIRASFVPTMYGDRIVLRLLDKSRTLLDPMDLGMHDEHLDIFHRHIRATQGLVLMTGPTGSGKTTSIYAALDQLNEVHRSIITIEDPIEYRMVGVSQIQVSEVRQMGFAEIFREVLRQDPNVVLLGEVRDADSAQVAVTAASTGHLVFTTLHTNNAAAAIPRLLMMGADPVVLSDAVHLIIAQRLVRRLCPECKQPDPLPDERLTKLGLKRDDLGDHQFYVAGPGCERCNETRHAGRIGVFEFLVPDDEIRQMIIERTPALSIERHARELGMRLMADDALQKARDGVISLDEYVHVPGAI
ncbi:Flp pilus assembly complex ATPase component TadA, partial [bacterium]|nr:Flp pilus assembly complex ATPase component TadA [bacterium]